MRFMQILLMASILSVAPGSFAMADWWNGGGWHGGGNGGGGGGGNGAPLPVVGAGLPILAGVGLYYWIRNRRRG